MDRHSAGPRVENSPRRIAGYAWLANDITQIQTGSKQVFNREGK